MHEWVAEAAGRVTVFLGAGASVPAGLPVSRELTNIVVSAVDKCCRAPEAWRFVRGRIGPTTMDVEQLYRSIGDLRQILSSSVWRNLVDIPTGVDEMGLERVRSDIFRATIAYLREVSTGATTDYLSALVEADVLGIATLNFDTLVENAARGCSAPVLTGVDEWDGGFHWPSLGDFTPLLKLHGSLNWGQVIRKPGPIPISGFETLALEDEYSFGGGGIFSDLRFGAENKLTQAGAMPALLEAFTHLLERSELVVAVGYSFRDPHVDVILNRWAALDDARRLLVIDPTLVVGDLEAFEERGSGWFGHMVAGLRHDTSRGRQERVSIVAESAQTAFDSLFR